MALGSDIAIRAADARLCSKARVNRSCGDVIEASVLPSKDSVTGLCVDIRIDSEPACVIKPHERSDADSVAMVVRCGETIPADVYVPQRLMCGPSNRAPVGRGFAELIQLASTSSENHDGQCVDASMFGALASPSGLALSIRLAFGHTLVVMPRLGVMQIALRPTGSGLHGVVEVLVPPAVLSTFRA